MAPVNGVGVLLVGGFSPSAREVMFDGKEPVVKRMALWFALERMDPPSTLFGEFEITMTAEALLRGASRSVAIKRRLETR